MEKSSKTLIIVLIVVLVLSWGFIAYGAYKYYKDTDRLEKEIKDLKSTSSDESSDSESASEESSDCASTLTEAEEAVISDWEDYTNATHGYSYKISPDWNNTAEEANIHSFDQTLESKLVGFQFRSASLTEIGVDPSYTLFDEEEITVACEDAVKNYYRSTEYHMTWVVFNKDGTPHVIMLSYDADMGASLASDLDDELDIMLKTITFE